MKNTYAIYLGDDTITGDIEVLVTDEWDRSITIDRNSFNELKEIFENEPLS
jgi:hypothetical protein